MALAPAGAIPLRRVRVALPSLNPQFLPFWVALGAGAFAAAGLELDLTVAAEQLGAPLALTQGQADVALLPPPLYLRLIATRQPVVCFANLLRNDPVNVVLTERAATEAGVVEGMPSVEAIRRLAGLRIGVAPGPARRLRELCRWAGNDLDTAILPGPEQIPAFAQGAVDGLYAHTPHLEEALVEHRGVLAVHCSRGDIAPTAFAQIHACVASRAFAGEAPAVIDAIVDCLASAMDLVRDGDPRAPDGLLASGLPGLSGPHVECRLAVYRPAVPASPAVTPDGLREADAFGGGAAEIGRLPAAELAPFIWSHRPAPGRAGVSAGTRRSPVPPAGE